jgi:hypothetical protein
VQRKSKVKQWLVQNRGEGCYPKGSDNFCLSTHCEIYTEPSALQQTYINPKDWKWNVWQNVKQYSMQCIPKKFSYTLNSSLENQIQLRLNISSQMANPRRTHLETLGTTNFTHLFRLLMNNSAI